MSPRIHAFGVLAWLAASVFAPPSASAKDRQARAANERMAQEQLSALIETRARQVAEQLFLFFPFEGGIHPDAVEVENRSVQWAVDLGLANGRRAVEKLRAARIGRLSSFVYRDSPLEVVSLAADWTTLFCFLDDFVEDDRFGLFHLSFYLDKILSSARQSSLPPDVDDPRLAGLADVVKRVTEVLGPAIAAQFLACLEELFEGYIWEELNRSRSLSPDLKSYELMRLSTIGLRPQFLFAAGDAPSLPEVLARHPCIRELEAATCRAVAWANDVFTYEKEIETGEMHNLVLVLMEQGQLSLCEALQQARALHDKEVRRFLTLRAELLRIAEHQAAISRHVTMLERWVRGHLDWAQENGRYQQS